MAAIAASPFSYLHNALKSFYGTGVKIWLPATRNGTTYTVGVACVAAPLTARAAEDMGLLTMPQDGVVIHVTREGMPFEPRADDLFLLGVTASGRKYRIMTATGAEGMHDHYRITAERHQ